VKMVSVRMGERSSVVALRAAFSSALRADSSALPADGKPEDTRQGHAHHVSSRRVVRQIRIRITALRWTAAATQLAENASVVRVLRTLCECRLFFLRRCIPFPQRGGARAWAALPRGGGRRR
jgi:hypothetical protein